MSPEKSVCIEFHFNTPALEEACFCCDKIEICFTISPLEPSDEGQNHKTLMQIFCIVMVKPVGRLVFLESVTFLLRKSGSSCINQCAVVFYLTGTFRNLGLLETFKNANENPSK